MNEYARSSMYVARYHLLRGGNDLELARDLMEEVANSNSEEVSQATDMLKKINLILAAKHVEEAAMHAQEVPSV